MIVAISAHQLVTELETQKHAAKFKRSSKETQKNRTSPLSREQGK